MSSERFQKERKKEKHRGVGEETELGDTQKSDDKIFYRKQREKYLICLKKQEEAKMTKMQDQERKENYRV